MAPASANTADRQFAEIYFGQTFPPECSRDIPSTPIRLPGLCWKDCSLPKSSHYPACACMPALYGLPDTEIVSILGPVPGLPFSLESAASSRKAGSVQSVFAIGH